MTDDRNRVGAGNRITQDADELEGSAVAGRPRASMPVVLLSTIGVLAVMYVARDLLIPVVLAILLALLLRPLMRRMRALHLPDVLSALVLVAGVAIVVVVVVLMLAGQAQSWLAHAPQTVARVRQLLPAQAGPLQSIQETTAAVEEMGRSGAPPMEVKVQSSDLAYMLLGVSGHIVGAAVVVFVLGFFLLAFSDSLLKQAIAAQPSFGHKRSVVQVLQEVEGGISRYLYTITAINICLGIATAIAMRLLGVPNPVLWGVMATVANYVPHVGRLSVWRSCSSSGQ